MRLGIGMWCLIILLTGCASKGQVGSNGHGSVSGTMGEPVREVLAYGFVTQVSVERGVINIKHAPIPEMNWAPMVMDFRVADEVELTPFKRGDKVEFVLEVDQQKNYRIKAIAAATR